VGLAALCVMLLGVSRLVYPFDVGHYEGGLWAPAQLMLLNRNPYDLSFSDRPPFVMAPYGPVFYSALAPGLGLFGPQFWWGRGLSLLSLLACCVAIVFLIRQLQNSTERSPNVLPAWLGVGLFLSSMPVPYWAGVQRPDFLALALSLWGLERALSPQARPWAAGLLLALAFGCRQTAIVPFLLAAGWLWSRHRRQAWTLCGTFGVVCAVSITLFNFSSRGGFVWQLWILSSSVGQQLEEAFARAGLLLVVPSAFVVAGSLIVGRRLWLSRAEDEEHARLKYLGPALGASSLLAFVTSSRHGANANYWLEPCALAGVLAPSVLARVLTSETVDAEPKKWESDVVWRGCFAAVALSALIMGSVMQNEERKRWRSLPYFQAVVRELKRVPGDGPVYGLFPELSLAAGKSHWFNDFYQYRGHSLRHRQVWHNVVRQRKLAAILSNEPTPPGYTRIRVRSDGLPVFISLDVRDDLLPGTSLIPRKTSGRRGSSSPRR
jgi:hypothetical protein